MTEAVILIPGIMGSELYFGSERIWPGAVSELLLSYRKLSKLLTPDLIVGDVIRSVSISDQYGSLISALSKCGFREQGPKPTLIVCPYDWRKDNALAAERLAEKVVSLREIHGPQLVITLIAHSMGGLVSRYFLESRNFTETSHRGFDNVRRLITIGTPHRGAPLALHAALGQVRRLFLSADQVKELANNRSFPALYQLLPPPSEPFLWDTSLASRLEAKSPYDSTIAQLLGLSAENLKSATDFHNALNPLNRSNAVDYFCFVGTRQSTISNVRFDFTNVKNSLPALQKTEDGGDGTVPSWSASFSGMQQMLVGGDHGGLFKTREVLSTLAALLGKSWILTNIAQPNAIRLSLADEVLFPQQVESLAIFLTRVSKLDAELVVHKRADITGNLLSASSEISRTNVNYNGPPLDSIALEFVAPQYPGIYEIDIEVNKLSVADRRIVIFVQNPT